MPEKSQERRRYFRVMDHVGLRISCVSDSEVEDGEVLLQTPAERLVKVNSAINKMLASLKKRDENLATLLGLLNHKMDLLVSEELQESDSLGTFSSQEVNISACGIAFPFPRELSKAQAMSLGIKLYPSEEIIHVLAMVVGCDRRDAFAAELSEERKAELKEQPYWVRANFEDISTVEQELLAQHVIQKQALELAGRRHA